MNRILPHNIEAEESLLGAILIDQEALTKVGDMIRPEDFYKDSHRLVYDAMIELFERHEPIDLLTIGNRLDEKNFLKEIGGRTKLVELTNKVATAAHISSYAEIIQKKATLRRLIRAASKMVELGYDESEEVDILIDNAEQELFNVSSNFLKQAFVPIRSVLTGAFERIDELHRDKGKMRGVPSGFKGLDNLLGGLQKSDLIILAARPSVGKTSFALDIARHASVNMKKKIGLLSF